MTCMKEPRQWAQEQRPRRGDSSVKALSWDGLGGLGHGAGQRTRATVRPCLISLPRRTRCGAGGGAEGERGREPASEVQGWDEDEDAPSQLGDAVPCRV